MFFCDDAYRTEDELIEGSGSSTIRRRVPDGTAYRQDKAPLPTGAIREVTVRETPSAAR